MVPGDFGWRLSDLGVEELIQFQGEVAVADLVGSYQGTADILDFVAYFDDEAPARGFIIGIVESEQEDDGLATELNVARYNESTWPQTEG